MLFPSGVYPPLVAITPESAGQGFQNFVEQFGRSLGGAIPSILGALAILLVGWIVAMIGRNIVWSILKKVGLDQQIAKMITGHPTPKGYNIARWIAEVVFWVILLIAIVAAVEALKLTAVAQPINGLLQQVLVFLPKLLGAAALAGVAWLLANLVKTIVLRSTRSLNLDQRFAPSVDSEPMAVAGGVPSGTAPVSASDTIANILYWLVFLLFLPLILNALELQGLQGTIQGVLDPILGFLPKLFGAVIIGIAGWLAARIVKGIVTNFLAAAGTDRLGSRMGLQAQGQSLSGILGTIAFVLILLPTAVIALQSMQMTELSGFLRTQVLDRLPQIFTAVAVLVGAIWASRFVANLVTSLAQGMGFDQVMTWLGMPTPTMTTSPSQILGIVVQVGIILFAALMACDILALPQLQALALGVLFLTGRILAGIVVLALGLFLANLVFRLITATGSRQSYILAQVARIAVITLVAAMGLEQIGIGANIVNLAFGLLLGGIAVAIALAFGLGGRDVANEQLRAWLGAFRDAGNQPPRLPLPPPPPPAPNR